MKHNLRAVLTSVSLAIAFIPTAQAEPNLVLNGGFELGGIGGYQAGLTDWHYTPTVSGSGLEWVESSTGTTSMVGSWVAATQAASPTGGNFYMADGQSTTGSNYSGTITQTISGLTQGDTYVVTFYQAATSYAFTPTPYGPSRAPAETAYWNVGFGSQHQNSDTINITAASATGTGGAAWQKETLLFTASAASDVLSFLSVGTGNPPVLFLDGVTVSIVPEPFEIALLGLGLPMIMAATRKQKAKLA
jgi:hypothetical protein